MPCTGALLIDHYESNERPSPLKAIIKPQRQKSPHSRLAKALLSSPLTPPEDDPWALAVCEDPPSLQTTESLTA